MKTQITIKELEFEKLLSQPAEAKIGSVMRGGYYNPHTDTFCYSGGTAHGIFKCYNYTDLTIHMEIN